MTHESIKEFGIFGCVMGLTLLMILPLPVRAQVEQKREVAAVMQAAIEYVHYNKPYQREKPSKGSLAEHVKIAPKTVLLGSPSKSVSENVRKNLARDLATRMGAETATYEEAIRCTTPQDASERKKNVPEIKDASDVKDALESGLPYERNCHFTNKDTKALMMASIPKISGSEARVKVERWIADGKGPVSSLTVRLKLKRDAVGEWQVTEMQPLIIAN